MDSEDRREIYRQRFESERASYRLEWQIFQWGVAIGLVTLGLGKDAFKPEWWQYLIAGAVFIKFSYAMQRIAVGYRDNHEKLSEIGRLIGDEFHRPLPNPWLSAAVRSRLTLHVVGVALVIVGHCKDFLNFSSTPRLPLVFALVVIGAVIVAMSVELFLWIRWQVKDIAYEAELKRGKACFVLILFTFLMIIVKAICLHFAC